MSLIKTFTLFEVILVVMILGLLSLIGQSRLGSSRSSVQYLGQKDLLEEFILQGQVYSSSAQTHLMLVLENQKLYWLSPEIGKEFSLDIADFTNKITQGASQEVISFSYQGDFFINWPLPLIISPTGRILHAEGEVPPSLISLELDGSDSWNFFAETGYLQTNN